MRDLWEKAQLRQSGRRPFWGSQARSNMAALQRGLEQDARRAELEANFQARLETHARAMGSAKRLDAFNHAMERRRRTGAEHAHDIDNHLLNLQAIERLSNANLRRFNEEQVMDENRRTNEARLDRMREKARWKAQAARRAANPSLASLGPYVAPEPNPVLNLGPSVDVDALNRGIDFVMQPAWKRAKGARYEQL
jgi:hypothetical protein